MVGAPFLRLQPPPDSTTLSILILYDVGGSHRNIADLSVWLNSSGLVHSLHASLLIGLLDTQEDAMRNFSDSLQTPHPSVLEGEASSLLGAAENVVDGVVYTFGKHDPSDVRARLTPHSVNAGGGAAYVAPDLLIRVKGVPGAQTQPLTTWQRHLAQRLGAESVQQPSIRGSRKTAVIEVDTGPQNLWPSLAEITDANMRPENLRTIMKINASGSPQSTGATVGGGVLLLKPRKFHEGHFSIVKLRKVSKGAVPWEVFEVLSHELPLP